MTDFAPDVIARFAQEWQAGKTVAELQRLTNPAMSRQRVVLVLHAAGIDPRDWRERNRAVGKALGPVPALKTQTEALCQGYLDGHSLAVLAETHNASRSTVRRALIEGGVVLRGRGRPVKPVALIDDNA